MKQIKRRICILLLALSLLILGAFNVYAYEGGDKWNGASNYEYFQVMYKGAAWNYRGSGYNYAWYRYSRNGKTIQYKIAYNGRVSGSVWDNLLVWGNAGRTYFNWNRG